MTYIANNSQLRYCDVDSYSYDAVTAYAMSFRYTPINPPQKEATMLVTPATLRSLPKHSIIPDLKLNDLLNDELTRMVMACDSVDEDDLREMLSLTADALKHRLS